MLKYACLSRFVHVNNKNTAFITGLPNLCIFHFPFQKGLIAKPSMLKQERQVYIYMIFLTAQATLSFSSLST